MPTEKLPIRIEASWSEALAPLLTNPNIEQLWPRIRTLYEDPNCRVFPQPTDVFTAFTLCPFQNTKVVILGQDPYHGKGQAHGLSFSVPEGVVPPPSLKNIFKEVSDDIGCTPPQHGTLTRWAEQGVFLLNSILTVEAQKPASHRALGWEYFTDAVIQLLSEKREHVVFLLWGAYAKQKQALIDTEKHLVLTAPHPSPFSATSGFFGCKHFSKTNEYLKQHGHTPIDW